MDTAGLNSQEAQRRLEKYGYNEPPKHKSSLLWQLILKFFDPLVGALILISIFSFFIGEKISAILIIAMASVSALLSFFQEHKAEKDVEKLRKMVHLTTMVMRDGKFKEIQLREIVPGDVVSLSAGKMVPADLRLIGSKDLYVNESAITGESVPVEKFIASSETKTDGKPVDILYMGSSIASGKATGLVLQTGLNSKFGKIAFEISSNTKTSFDKGINRFVYLMLRVIMVMAVIIFIINLGLKGDIFNAIFFSLAVAVGLVPEMLPMLVSVNLAKGAIMMARKKIIVKRLSAVQNFGAMNVLCTDKTGTLTEDNITLVEHCNCDGKDDENVFKLAYINSHFNQNLNNIIDEAIINHKKIDLNGIKKIDEIPFDYLRKKMSVVVENSKKRQIIVKGAPEEIFKDCKQYALNGKINHLNNIVLTKIYALYHKLSQDGYRVVAVAYKDVEEKDDYIKEDEKDLVFVGFMALLDPPKKTAKEAIENLEKLGIELIIITGDNQLVARKICQEVNFKIKNLLDATELAKLSEVELQNKIKDVNVFTRLDPFQKNKIITILKNVNYTVGFLGDGINDAPSLRDADVGIAVNNGADIAKGTADIILLEKDLRVLSECVLEGRKTFGNIVKYIKMGASSNFGNMFSMTGASIFLPFLPLLPVQIILNNFLYDFCQLTIPTDNVDNEYLIKPKPWNIDFIKRFMVTIGIVSSLFDFITFGVLWYIFQAGPDLFRTGWFLESLATQTLVIHIIRTRKIPFIESRPSFLLLSSSILVVLIGFAITFSHIGISLGFTKPFGALIATLLLIVLVYLFTVQLVKSWFVKKFGYE
jgi:Mg2+-importing ATPase